MDGVFTIQKSKFPQWFTLLHPSLTQILDLKCLNTTTTTAIMHTHST